MAEARVWPGTWPRATLLALVPRGCPCALPHSSGGPCSPKQPTELRTRQALRGWLFRPGQALAGSLTSATPHRPPTQPRNSAGRACLVSCRVFLRDPLLPQPPTESPQRAATPLVSPLWVDLTSWLRHSTEAHRRGSPVGIQPPPHLHPTLFPPAAGREGRKRNSDPHPISRTSIARIRINRPRPLLLTHATPQACNGSGLIRRGGRPASARHVPGWPLGPVTWRAESCAGRPMAGILPASRTGHPCPAVASRVRSRNPPTRADPPRAP